jgi:hypothetical protein
MVKGGFMDADSIMLKKSQDGSDGLSAIDRSIIKARKRTLSKAELDVFAAGGKTVRSKKGLDLHPWVSVKEIKKRKPVVFVGVKGTF